MSFNYAKQIKIHFTCKYKKSCEVTTYDTETDDDFYGKNWTVIMTMIDQGESLKVPKEVQAKKSIR